MHVGIRTGHGRRWKPGLAVFLASAACATVPPGSGGVVLGSSGTDPNPLGEGSHWTGFFSQTQLYDLRQQEHDEDLVGLTSDGASLELRASLVTYRLVPEELVTLAREIGPEYHEVIVRPVVQSTVRLVMARLRADELDTPRLRQAQDDITLLARERLRPHHILLTSVLIRGVFFDAPRLNDEIQVTAMQEQRVLEARQEVEITRARARVEEARGIDAAHRLLAPTLDRHLLDSRRVDAWSRLLTSPRVEVKVTASPLLLSPEEPP
jgi:regulator of protease activity HflC (stomatin/prohibitin superfamily)